MNSRFEKLIKWYRGCRKETKPNLTKERRLMIEHLESRKLMAVTAGTEVFTPSMFGNSAAEEENRVLLVSEPGDGSDAALTGMTLREAVEQANANSEIKEIRIDASIERIDLNDSLTITGSYTILAEGGTVISAKNSETVFRIAGTANEVTLKNLTIADSQETAGGGADCGVFVNSGTVLHAADCRIQDNAGYGVCNKGTLTMDRSIVSKNGKGGIYNAGSASSAEISSTLVDNNALAEGGLGGVYVCNGNLSMTNCTVADNGSCGVYLTSAAAGVINNSILTQNGPIQNSDLIVSVNSACAQNNNIIGEDVSFDSNYRLKEGSIAIDSGQNGLVKGNFDLDGNVRIVCGTCDVGAYEYTTTNGENPSTEFRIALAAAIHKEDENRVKYFFKEITSNSITIEITVPEFVYNNCPLVIDRDKSQYRVRWDISEGIRIDNNESPCEEFNVKTPTGTTSSGNYIDNQSEKGKIILTLNNLNSDTHYAIDVLGPCYRTKNSTFGRDRNDVDDAKRQFTTKGTAPDITIIASSDTAKSGAIILSPVINASAKIFYSKNEDAVKKATYKSVANNVINVNDVRARQTMYKLFGLQANTKYFVKIVTEDGRSASTSFTTAQVKLSQPVNVKLKNTGAKSATITWKKVENASKYMIEYSTNSSFTGAQKRYVSSSKKSFSITGLKSGTTYYYRVTAIGTGKYTDSKPSAARSFVTKTKSAKYSLATPVVSCAVMEDGKAYRGSAEGTSVPYSAGGKTGKAVKVSWGRIINADEYLVEYSANEDFSDCELLVSEADGNMVIIDGLCENTVYYFRVTAVSYSDDYDDSEPGYAGKGILVPSEDNNAVQYIGVIPGTENAYVYWSEVPGASSYTVQYRQAGSDSKHTITVTDTKTTINGLNPGTDYCVSVAANIPGYTGAPLPLDYSFQTLDKTAIDAPYLRSLNLEGTSKLTVKWDGVEHAASYQVQYSADSSFSAFQTKEAAGTSCTIDGLSPDTLYYVRVIAVPSDSAYEISAASNVKKMMTNSNRLSAPKITVTLVTNSSFRVDWNSVPNAAEYRVEIALDEDFVWIERDGRTTATGAVYDNSKILIMPGDRYYIRVKAIAEGSQHVDSGWSEVKSVKIPEPAQLSAPSVTAQRVTDSSFRVDWNSVPNAAEYRVEIATDEGFSNIVRDGRTTATGAVYDSSKITITPGTRYYIRVKAVAGDSQHTNSGWSEVKSVKIPEPEQLSAPSVTAQRVTNSSFRVDWNSVPNAAEYRVEIATDEGFSNIVRNGKTTSTGAVYDSSKITITPGTRYYIRVKAIAGDSQHTNSGWSEVKSVKIPEPAQLSAPTIQLCSLASSTSINVAWGSVSHAVNYRIRVATDKDFNNVVLKSYLVEGRTSICLDTEFSVKHNTKYYIQVKAVSSSSDYVNSDWSKTAVITTK